MKEPQRFKAEAPDAADVTPSSGSNCTEDVKTNAEDTRRRKPASIFGAENCNRFSERVSRESDFDVWIRLVFSVFERVLFGG